MIYAQLAQDRPKRARGEVTATVAGNDSELVVGWVPPDFMGTGSLTHKLASQLLQSSAQIPVVHGAMSP